MRTEWAYRALLTQGEACVPMTESEKDTELA